MREPGEGIRERLGEKVKVQSAQTRPIRIAAGEFHDAGAEDQAEQQQNDGQPREAGRRGGTQVRFHAPRGKENGQEAGFDEQGIPLVAIKILPGHAEREHHGPECEEAKRLEDSNQRGERCGDADVGEEIEGAEIRG